MFIAIYLYKHYMYIIVYTTCITLPIIYLTAVHCMLLLHSPKEVEGKKYGNVLQLSVMLL